MAAEAAVSSSGLPLCPSFAVVWSFLERYGAALDLPEMSFPQMESYLRDTSTVPRPLVELHVKLLRKLGKMVTTDRWEKYLAKVCQDLNSTWAWELEQRGYQEMTLECKSGILKYLCECQFDDNLKFKMAVNEEEPERMRLQPIGRDRQGHLYWLQLDQEHNIRLYTEEQDDQHGATWRCIVRSRKDLVDALKLLRAQDDPNLLQQETCHSPSLEGEYSCSEKKQSVSKWPVPPKEEPAKQEVPQECPKVEPRVERSNGKPPFLDNHVRTITAVREESPAPVQNTVSVLRAPGSLKQEAVAGSIRSSQQATIPLKKRELKLSQDYHSNHRNNTSSIIVPNPSVIRTSGSELTNGTAPLPLHPQGAPNQVAGAAFGHVGVIRNLHECSQSQQLSLPCPFDQRAVRRESVLVHKTETQAPENIRQPSTITLTPDLRKGLDVDVKPAEAAVEKCRVKEERNEPTAASKEAEEMTVDPGPGEDNSGVNGTLASGTPKVEASSELQSEGIRLKIKIPPQRQDKLSVKQRQRTRRTEGEPRLRRSARICRPSSKAAESQRKRVGRSKGALHLTVRAGPTRKRRGRPKWTTTHSKRPKVKEENPEEQLDGEKDPEPNTTDACTQCGQTTLPELILLCDLCDSGYHTACLRPPLMMVPDGDWFCPPCQHKQLCERLEEQLSCLDSALKRQELAERRRERLVYVGISVENILPEGDKEKSPKKKDVRKSRLGRRSTRARKHISYRFDDFDDAINEAIEDNRELSETHTQLSPVSDEEMEYQQAITGHAAKRSETQRPIRRSVGLARKKRRLNDLESDSTAADSEDEYLLSHSSEEEEELVSWGADEEADSELCSGDSLSGDRAVRRPPKHSAARGRRKICLEDSPNNMDWDVSSLSDSGEESSGRALRRGLTQQVNYCESSSSDSGPTPALKTQRRRQECVSSDYSDVSAFSRDTDEECAKEEHSRRKQTRTKHRLKVKQRQGSSLLRLGRPRQIDSHQSSEDEHRRSTRRTPRSPPGPHNRPHRRPQS